MKHMYVRRHAIRKVLFAATCYIAAVCSSLCNAQIAETWAGGDGTEENPYQISDISHLRKLAYDVNNGKTYRGEYFIQTSDIRDNKKVIESDGSLIKQFSKLREWNPIGKYNTSSTRYTFEGSYNGKGYSIAGIYYSEKYDYTINGGIFGCIKDATIKNIIIKDSHITSIINSAYGNILIDNCINFGTTKYGLFYMDRTYENSGYIIITNCGNYGLSYCAGIACRIIHGELINCYNYGHIEPEQDLSIGIITTPSKMYNCVNYGVVEAEGGCYGIFSRYYGAEEAEAINLINIGECRPIEYSYGIAGSLSMGNEVYGTATNCYILDTSAQKLFKDIKGCSGDQMKMTEKEMKDPEFIEKLNANVDKIRKTKNINACYWKAGNDGFPILEIINEDYKASVDNIIQDSDNKAEPIYYNLQGLRIDKPSKGLFIEVRGNHSRKVVIGTE